MKKYFIIPLIIISFTLLFSSCDLSFLEPPTKSSMEGVWKVTLVTNSSGQDITSQVSFPIVGFYLSSDNTVLSTAGPLIMYIVYGPSKFTQIASKIDQVFDYASLDFNGGEFFIGGGVQPRFTLEMKLEGLPGQKALTTLLDIIGVTNDYLDMVIYHKFMDVAVSFQNNHKTMIWEIDDVTTAVYNKKDSHGNYVLWGGWPANNFQHCKIWLEKQTMDLSDVVRSAKK